MALRLRDKPTWTAFLTNAGIPPDEAGTYADTFVASRITEATISSITAENLAALQITVLGDVLAILQHIKSKTSTTSTTANIANVSPSTHRPASTTVKLPEISSEMTHQQFRKVRVDWDVFKRITKIPTTEFGGYLYNACEDSVQTNIINCKPDFLDLTEVQMLETIEKIVTKHVNPMVHRMNFARMKQVENQSVQDFLSKLRSAAIDCEYACPNCETDISKVNIKDQLLQGLYNDALQTDILAKADQLKSVEDVVKHAEAFESALRDQSELSNNAEASRISEYKKSKKLFNQNNNFKQGTSFKSTTKVPQTCQGCGSKEHGVIGKPPRHTHCLAWGQRCTKCHLENHLNTVCRRGNQDVANALIAYIESDIKAHVYSSPNERLQEIPAELTPDCTNAHATTIDIFPDSGANICLGGPQQLSLLGLTESHLRPSKKQVKTVGGKVIVCKGWTPIKFQIDRHSTVQPVYFCDLVDRLYFSKQGCIEMNILHPSYPTPMSVATINEVNGNTQPPFNQSTPIALIGGHGLVDMDSLAYSSEISSLHGNHESSVRTTGSNQSIQQRSPPPPRPSKIPFPPITDNVPKLKKYIVDSFRSTAFNNTDVPFPSLPPPHFKIFLKPDAIPYAQHTPIPVAHHQKAAVKQQLDEDVKRGMIIPVPLNTPVVWCAPMVVTTKSDGSPRRTIDYQHLNSQCFRQTHFTHSPFDLASQVPPNTKKTVIDAVDGFHSVKVNEDSQHLLMFITEWGRYIPLRMPQGYFASGDAYTQRTDNITKDVNRKLKIIDDTLLYDDTIEEAFFHTWDYLTLCSNNGIVANLKKFQFCEDTVEFAGLSITPAGVSPSEKTLSAIRNFPIPTNTTGARSWFGLVQQVAWAYSIGSVMAPFRDLLHKNKFYWDNELDKIFQNSKETLINLVIEGVQSFDINRKTCLQTDWSSNGIGYLLLQKYCKCTPNSPVCCKDGWKLIFAGSRFTKPAESRYSPPEGEALALAWALEHSRMYTLGCPDLLVAVDHKPLLGIFNDRDLESIKNPRLRKLKEDTLAWRFAIMHCPGKWTRGADALSRQKVSVSLSAIHEVPDPSATAGTSANIALSIASVCAFNELRSITVEDVQQAARKDKQYQDLLEIIRRGFPSKRNLTNPSHLRNFWDVHHRLTELGGVAYMDNRIVIPAILRRIVLDTLHSANQGVSSMKFRANNCVYWPGLDNSIKQHRETCKDCNENAPSQTKEPLILTSSPAYPFQQICADYFEIGNYSYLDIVDRFSGWLCIYYFPGQMGSKSLVNVLRDLFTSYGAPEELSSDGGPQFIGNVYKDFLADWGVKSRLSSVAYPQSNGRAELGVKTAKRIIHNNVASDGSLNTDKVARALLQYRNTPLPDLNLSPAQILLHRTLRDGIPAHPRHYRLHKSWIISAEERERAYASRNQQITDNYNTHAHDLPPLDLGSDVLVQKKGKKKKWDKSGRIVEVLPHRQYRIRMHPTGRITLQNRRFLRPSPIEVPVTSLIPSAPLPNTSKTPTSDLLLSYPPSEAVQTHDESGANTIPDLPPVLDIEPTPMTPAPVTPVRPTTPTGIGLSPTQSTAPSTSVRPKLPLAIRKLQTYNKPGLKEDIMDERR